MQRDSVHCSLGLLGFAIRLVNSQGSKFTFMFSCLGVTTRLSLVAMEYFGCPSQPLGPLQSKEVKHRDSPRY